MSATGGETDGVTGKASTAPTSGPGGVKWASWNRHGDGEGGHKLDTAQKGDNHEKNTSQLPRGRSYQENRRHERDRRDNMRRNEKKSDWSIGKKVEHSGEGDDKKGGKRELDDVIDGKSSKVISKEEKDATDLWSRENHDKRPSRSKSDSAQPDGVRKKSGMGTVDRKAEGDTHMSSWGEKGGDPRKSEHNSRAASGTGLKDGASKGQGDGPRTKANSSSSDLLSLLKPKRVDKGKPISSSGGVSNSSNSTRGKGKLPADVKVVGKSVSDLEAQWQKEEEERNKEKAKREAEEEEKRKEEERIREEKERQEEEERKKREEEARILEEERKIVTDFAREGDEKLKMKAELRETNRVAIENRPDESFYSKLDSSLKKNTTFVRKLRNLTESQKDSLMKEFHTLNLSKYIGEASSAITEAKLKMSDVGCALHICSLMHQRYADFTKTLFENWHRILMGTKKDEKVSNPSKLRVDLRFFADLITVGVFTQKEGLPLLANQLTLLIGNDKDDHSNLPILLSFCRHCGDDYAGLLSRKYRLLSEKYEVSIPRSKMLPAERQKACRHLLKEYYSSLCRHLLRDHENLRNMEHQNRKILQTKGELSEERRDKFEALQLAFQKLIQNTSMLADLLDDRLPELQEDDMKTDSDGCGLDIFSTLKGAEYQYDGDTSLFEDDDTRQFYETLPDLKAIIPGILYKDSEHAATIQQQQKEAGKLEEELENLDVEELEKEMEVLEEGAEKDTAGEEGKATVEEEVAPSDAELTATDVDEEDGDVGSSMKVILDAYLSKLPNCVNRELIDKAAIEFCMNLNTKANRKKLVRALFTVQRTRYDLLPFYSRLVATLSPCMPDVANELVMLLRSDFRWHVRKKDQINIESKLKTVRFIGELVKFDVFPKADALLCLKMLMFDFSHHNIEMACALLESAGRFLYRSPDSHHRTKVYLDVMMRKKAALHLDSRYTTMIENAFYYSNPPDVKMETHKERPPMHEYIRRLLYRDLSKVTTEKVLRQMRKLNWDDLEISAYTCKCMTGIWNVRYNSIHCCANLLAGLARYHETFAIQVVDGVLEDIRLGMEINHPKYNQRRVSSTKYLGELYNYRLLESSVIFKTLYSFITFGVTFDELNPSMLDPPEHLFRLRLVCVVLDTCGQYFDRGSSKKKLDCFLVYFQRYYWYKKKTAIWSEVRPFPIDIDYMVQETVETLRPNLHMCDSYDEAAEAADQLDKQFRAKLAEVFTSHPDGDEGADTEEEYALPTIHESDEMDELSQGVCRLDEDRGTQDSEMDGENNTGSCSQRADDMTGECEADEDEDDDLNLDSAGEADDEEDQVAVLTGGLKHLKCTEDDDFMTAFDTMVTENIQARNQESVKVPQFDIAVPVHLKSQQKPKGLPLPGFPEDESIVINTTTKSSVNFVLMTRKGNRQQFSTLNVPISAEFATKFKEREQAERAEKERMKRVVLDIHERQEEEDYQEMLVSLTRPAPANLNRERRVRYQHPKGAPDADLIFGSKKR